MHDHAKIAHLERPDNVRPSLDRLTKILLPLVVAALIRGDSPACGDEPAPGPPVIEESLVWRTRVAPRAADDWSPSGFEFGVRKPAEFRVESTCGLPFRKVSEPSSPQASPRGDWETRPPLRLEIQPTKFEEKSDAPQFGVNVASGRAGLGLTRPTFLHLSAGSTTAWMPDALEFRIERATDGASFSVSNADPHSTVTLHNLRFSVDSREIDLAEAILLDQQVPLAHPFSDPRQADTPPVVRPKLGFSTFQKRFAESPTPLVLASGASTRDFILGEMTQGRWIYVEGFATRTDAEGRPILDERRLPASSATDCGWSPHGRPGST